MIEHDGKLETLFELDDPREQNDYYWAWRLCWVGFLCVLGACLGVVRGWLHRNEIYDL